MDIKTFELLINNIWTTTLSLSLWLLIGLLIAGILHLLIPDSYVEHHLGAKRGLITVLKAVIFGVPMPLCSCGVIPAALGIKKQGAGDGASIGFLISTPQTGIDSIMVSASMLGLPFAIFKLCSAFILGLLGGSWAYFTTPPQATATAPSTETAAKPKPQNIISAIFAFAIDDLLKMIWRWLVAGIVISALISTYLPHNFFTTYLPDNIFVSLGIVLLISLPMYVCATASVPIAAALVSAGMPPGAALVFLMAGPASNIATIGAIYRAFGIKKLLIYLTTIIVGSMFGGLIFNSVIPPTAAAPVTLHGDHGPLAVTAAIIFSMLILRFIAGDLLNYWRKYAKKNMQSSEEQLLTVTGMTCEGCAAHLKNALLKLPSITAVEISLADKQVKIAGNALNAAAIEQVISQAGYHWQK